MSLSRRQVRYLCFRLKTEAEGGPEAPDLPESFRETFEGQELFRGWGAFGVTWDVGLKDFWTVVRLKESLSKTWEKTLIKVVPVFPGLEDYDQKPPADSKAPPFKKAKGKRK